jgi:transposase-like protein
MVVCPCRHLDTQCGDPTSYQRPRLGDKWHLDEKVLTLKGEPHYLWRAVDQDGNILDILAQRRRDTQAVKQFFRKRLKGLTDVPRVILTDNLQSYGAAKRATLPGGTSATSISQQQGRELAPTDPPAGAAYATAQITRPRLAVLLCLWPHRTALPPAPA